MAARFRLVNYYNLPRSIYVMNPGVLKTNAFAGESGGFLANDAPKETNAGYFANSGVCLPYAIVQQGVIFSVVTKLYNVFISVCGSMPN